MTPGSGNQWHTKNDVRTPQLSVECKHTTRESYSMKLADLEKAEFNAMADGRAMAFKVTFDPPRNTRAKSYVIMTEDDYLRLYEAAQRPT